MEDESKEIQFNSEGSLAQRRFLPMLHPEYFKIDDRTLVDFLVFIEKYADHIYSHQTVENSTGKTTSSTWKSFFNSDLSVFLAKLSSISHNDLLPFYLEDEIAGGHETQRKILQPKLDSIMNIVSVITDSYQYIVDLHGDDPKTSPLLGYIKQIKSGKYLKIIFESLPLIGLTVPNTILKQRHFTLIWGEIHISSDRLENKDALKSVTTELNISMNSFLDIANRLVSYSMELFWNSVNNNQNHTPGTALFIAFLKLYHFVQDDLNKITAKHLDYFYKELLHQKIKPSEPDHVHIYFSLADYANSCLIEKGTLFKAGIDSDGYDYLYEADDFLTINKAKITDFCSIRVAQNKAIGIENSYDFISGIYQSNILTSQTGGFDFSSNPLDLFPSNEYESDNLDVLNMKDSGIGFAIAAPVLMLKEGIRKCDLILNFNLKSMSALLTFLERYTVNENLTFDRAFHKLFYRAFTIYLTTSEGWYEVENYKFISLDSAIGSFKISFSLPMGAPEIVAMGDNWDKKETELYDTEWPVLKICLTTQKTMFMYSYLKDLTLSDCSIQVSVSGIKNLEVFNDLGKLDISNPFYPFGSSPVLGSSLLIGNEELYKKNIDDFSLELQWYNLPRDKGGFKTYYKEYDPTIDNDSFKIGITALSDFEFYPISKKEIQQYSLFSVEEETNEQLPILAPTTILQNFDINRLRINPDYSKQSLSPYSNKTKSGYIKLELLSPEMCFGQDIYPALFSTKIITSIKSSQVTLPNPPYIPQLKSVTLNYKASSRIDFQTSSFIKSNLRANEKTFLLQAFGIQTIFKNNIPLANTFLPSYFHNGYLLIGLDHITPNEPLTLHFIAEPNAANDLQVNLPVIEWFYVSNDKWIAFDKKDLIFDTTLNFTTTGIIKLLMPKSIENKNKILPTNKYWIVAAIKGELKLIAKLKGFYTQALKLSWKAHKDGASWSKNISANTIQALVNARTEITSIIQPSPSFGGRHKENSIEFYTRVSERLRHRNRCITAWDYEHLVLEKFPFVSQVKCISPIDNPNHTKEGNIILIVRSRSTMSNLAYNKFSYNILHEIKSYIEQYASPFVNIQVINPVYEEVKISASIKLKDQAYKGIGIENLHRDLRNFISPWYEDTNKEMQFNGSINMDELETFIETRSYISYVTNLSIMILHYSDKSYSISDSVLAPLANKTLYASRPWVVLVPMKQHMINLIESDEFIAPSQAAIENLRLGNEFILTDKVTESVIKSKEIDKKNNSGSFIVVDIDL